MIARGVVPRTTGPVSVCVCGWARARSCCVPHHQSRHLTGKLLVTNVNVNHENEQISGFVNNLHNENVLSDETNSDIMRFDIDCFILN